MTAETGYIAPDIVEKIKDASVLHEIVQMHTELRKKGSDLVGNCPYCGSKNFSVSPSKGIYKCFSGCGTEGNSAVKFLIQTQGMTFPDAMRHLAGIYKIEVETVKQQKKKAPNRAMKFRDAQLLESGIEQKDQVYFLHEDERTQVEADRYQAATVDRAFNVQPGDDMVLHYLDLDGKPMTYLDNKGTRKVLLRVRWANPDLHLSKDGKPMKYQSPPYSGSHLWLPQRLLESYKGGEIIETLYITEGEKKADRMCKDGLMSVGIMGIHNFSLNEMPRQFEQLIKRCAVRRVVFVLDADWQDISLSTDKAVDQRPKGFFKAVVKFKDYFYAFSSEGIYLDLFFSYGKDKALKGMDDLLVRGIKAEGPSLKEDFEAAFIARDGVGQYIDVVKITDLSSYQLKQYWHLHSPAAFMNQHAEELKKLRDFQFNKLRWKWSEEEQSFQLAQKILPHEQFWGFVEDKQGNPKPFYIYQNMRVFLNNRGYGQYEYEFDQYRFVHVEGRVVKETSTSHIRRYVRDFVEDIGEAQVLEMILRGGNAYMGADKLADLYYKQLEFMQSDRDSMYLFFQDQYWHITPDSIEARPLADLPKYVWQNNLIRFSPTLYAQPMIRGERKGKAWDLTLSPEAKQCDMMKFYTNTSCFHWRKLFRLQQDADGRKRYHKAEGEEVTDADLHLQVEHFMAKIAATGYIMHDYLDYSLMKAIVCMDGNESEVGRSEGGTGKSIWSNQFEHVMPMEIVDGKSKTIEDDKHIYELVDERTRVITFDDVRVNFNFEWLFSQITRGITVNPKGTKRMRLQPPKFIINTNHAITGDSNSYRRRQYLLGFSDYYNSYRTPYDDFGYQLFHDWDTKDWNAYYNFLAACMQHFLRFRLDFEIPSEALERRRLRQQIGESFIEWASLVFDAQERADGKPYGVYLNEKLERTWLYGKYLDAYPEDKRYTTARIFKEKLAKFCQYAGLHFNPTTGGERLRSNGKEYFILAGKGFDARTMGLRAIDSDMDFNLNQTNAF
jgi:DNA primase